MKDNPDELKGACSQRIIKGMPINYVHCFLSVQLKPHFIDAPHIPLYVSYLSEVIDEFGWERASELLFYLGAQLVGHHPDEPERYRRDAIQLMRQMLPTVEGAALEKTAEFDEDTFVEALTSVQSPTIV